MELWINSSVSYFISYLNVISEESLYRAVSAFNR